MAIQAKRCTECNGLMEKRLGSWECQICGHSEPAPAERTPGKRRKAVRDSPKRESPGLSSSAAWKKEHGTHLLDFSKGSGRGPEPRSKTPPPHQAEYQTIQEFTKREQKKPKYYVEPGSSDAEDRTAEKKLAVEKNIYFGLWLLLSAYICYKVIVIIREGLIPIDLEWHEVIYIAVFCVAVMIGVMWYTLYCESPEIKWISIIIGCIVAVGQAIFSFIMFTNETFVDNLTFDSGYSGVIGLVVAAVLTVGWTCWYAHILYRDVQRMQS